MPSRIYTPVFCTGFEPSFQRLFPTSPTGASRSCLGLALPHSASLAFSAMGLKPSSDRALRTHFPAGSRLQLVVVAYLSLRPKETCAGGGCNQARRRPGRRRARGLLLLFVIAAPSNLLISRLAVESRVAKCNQAKKLLVVLVPHKESHTTSVPVPCLRLN